jgi:hypothetical protein
MRLNVYVDDEYVYGQRKVTVESLNSIQQLLLKNPLIINLGTIGYVPKINSVWDGEQFSEIDIKDYSGLIAGTFKEYYAIVLDNKVEEVLAYSDERNNAIMSSNPVFKLEEDNSGPVKMEAI